jgi:hypothetical protein
LVRCTDDDCTHQVKKNVGVHWPLACVWLRDFLSRVGRIPDFFSNGVNPYAWLVSQSEVAQTQKKIGEDHSYQDTVPGHRMNVWRRVVHRPSNLPCVCSNDTMAHV